MGSAHQAPRFLMGNGAQRGRGRGARGATPPLSLLEAHLLTGQYRLEGHRQLSLGGGALTTPSSRGDPGWSVCPHACPPLAWSVCPPHACPPLARNARGPGVRPGTRALRHARVNEGRRDSLGQQQGWGRRPRVPAGSASALCDVTGSLTARPRTQPGLGDATRQVATVGPASARSPAQRGPVQR